MVNDAPDTNPDRNDQSSSEVPFEGRLTILERHLDMLEHDQLSIQHRLFVHMIEVLFVTFGAAIVLALLVTAIGIQSWGETIAWFDTLMDVIIGTVAVISFLIYGIFFASERWEDWREGAVPDSSDEDLFP